MVSSNGLANVLGANAHIVRVYSPTWARAYARRNLVDGNGVGSRINSKHLQKARTNVLFMCFFIKKGWVWNMSNMVP
jgi:hypothetical protein